MMLKRYGSMSLATVLQPAIDYAENGYPISAFTARAIQGVKDSSRPSKRPGSG